MAEILILVDLPVGSANDIDTTELALLLRDVKAANIIDYTDYQPIREADETGYAEPQYEGY